MAIKTLVLLALAAARTRTIRLAVGVAVIGLREAPEAANAIATVNCIAPDRTFIGLGSGNTAMRTLGRQPTRLEAFARHIKVVRALRAGDASTKRIATHSAGAAALG